MIRLLLAGFFAAGCYAKCWNVTRGEDHMIAQCMDDDTQEPFTFYNHDMKPSNDNDTDFEYMADGLYEQYASFVPTPSNQTSTDIEQRDFGQFWSNCKEFVSGVCTTEMAFAGLSAVAAVGTFIVAALARAQQNAKLDTRPTIQCFLRNNEQVCIGYAVRYYGALDDGELEAVGEKCSQACAQQNEGCIFDFKGVDFVQVQCVTSKSVKCEVADQIRACD